MNPKQCLASALAVLITFVSVATIAADKNTYDEDKLSISVLRKEPVFVIKLKSNPTTGYTWFLKEYDSNLIAPTKHVFVAPGKKLIGAPGYEEWTFRVKPAAFTVPVQTTLKFVYSRPWGSSDDDKHVVFHVSAIESK